MASFEEIRLIGLCMATDNREAFSRLVVMHQEPLRRFLLNLTGGNASLTDDLAQETFVKAWVGIRGFKAISGFRTWLFRIAINEYLSYKRSRRELAEADNNDSYSSGRQILDPSDDHMATENRMDVQTLLSQLSDTERIVCLLFYLQDMPMKEIVKITGMPIGTVKSHLSRARVHLSKLIEK